MTFYGKIKWVLGILMVFVLIVTTNLIDRNNFVRVKDSVVTIYEDRLIANDLIFEMSQSVQKKEVALASSDSIFFAQKNDKVYDGMKGFIARFEETKLTDEESKVFADLKQNLETLRDSESAYVASGFMTKDDLEQEISKVKTNLYDLSKIQLREGSRQMNISKRAIDTVELFTQIEIYLLVFMAIVIQIIVMYRPKNKS